MGSGPQEARELGSLRRSIRATAAAPGSSRGPELREGGGDLFRDAPAGPGSPEDREALKRPGRSQRTRQEAQGGTQEAGKRRKPEAPERQQNIKHSETRRTFVRCFFVPVLHENIFDNISV